MLCLDRKKYLQRTIAYGEGIVGQACLEKDIVYLTHFPKDYIKITSGLGEAVPNVLAVIPLIHNEVVQSVIEVASFNSIAEHEFIFIRQFASLIAGEIESAKVNAQTQYLLERSQQQTEELKAQEEELRQNIEEMQSTQEEIARRNSEIEHALRAIREIGVLKAEFDLQGNLLQADENFLVAMQCSLEDVRGRRHQLFVKDMDLHTGIETRLWEKLSSGESQTGIFNA